MDAIATALPDIRFGSNRRVNDEPHPKEMPHRVVGFARVAGADFDFWSGLPPEQQSKAGHTDRLHSVENY